jgi:hypothetical protein
VQFLIVVKLLCLGLWIVWLQLTTRPTCWPNPDQTSFMVCSLDGSKSGWNRGNHVLRVLVKEREQAAAMWRLKEIIHAPESMQ